jgi:protein-disulfide isomerase
MPTDRTSSTTRSPSLLAPVIGLVAALGLATAVFVGGDTGATDPTAAGTQGAGSDEASEGDGRSDTLQGLERREEGDPRALGDVDAPVVMIEWSDFQCPFCGAFARDTKPELVERYVEEGLLRIEWRDFPVIGADSSTAALAGRAAAEQGAFWDLHDEIYAEERGRDSGELAEDALVEMAEGSGLDGGRFRADLGDDDHRRAVAADLELAQQLGITGTPAFLVNGELMIGGQPTELFAQAIERAAAEAGAS